MRCLRCGELIDESSVDELKMEWHGRCVKEFFGTTTLPELKINEEELSKLVAISVSEGLTIPGVQKKLSLYLEKETSPRLTLVNYPTGYILKPQTKEYDNLPEFEWLAMRMAKEAGIRVVPFALYRTDGGLVYLTKRIDRKFSDEKVFRYAMEDFCQLAERLAEDKYKGSYELCTRIAGEYSINPGLDISELFLRVVFSYVVGNSDLHLKNFSLIEREHGGRNFELSDAYDILPVNVVEPNDLDEMALSLNGKKRDLELEDFVSFANYCKISNGSGLKMIRKICDKKEKYIEIVENAPLNDEQKNAMALLISERCAKLMDV